MDSQPGEDSDGKASPQFLRFFYFGVNAGRWAASRRSIIAWRCLSILSIVSGHNARFVLLTPPSWRKKNGKRLNQKAPRLR